MGVVQNCKPRKEVLQGDLQDAIFAADFGYVVEGVAPAVYQDAAEFFRNTHPAAALCEVTRLIFERLSKSGEAGLTLRLSTGFGGGKTHTLIALWHLARNIGEVTLGTDLLPAAGRPKAVRVVGFDGEKAGTDVCMRHPELITHSLWGEIAYQLGGPEAYSKVTAVDDPEKAPDAALIRDIFPKDAPVLILLDELVKYIAKLSPHAQTVFRSVIGTIVSEVNRRAQTVMVITDPADQSAYAEQSAELRKAMEEVNKLDDELDRKTSHFDPIGEETAKVVARRLFDSVDRAAAERASADYLSAYQRIAKERPDLLPADAVEKAKKIVECYPFHPRLLETARDRLGAIEDFQKSRGTLRLFARIIRDIWENKTNIDIITAGEINWSNDRLQADLLDRIGRSRFRAAVDADVKNHAGRLDETAETDVHRRVASALLLESLELSPNSGMDAREVTLATARLSDVGHEPADALSTLAGACWHTYPDDSHTRYQFRYEANVNKQIEERAEKVPLEDARSDARTMIQSYFSGHAFKLRAFPSSAQDVPDTAELKLVLCDDEALAQEICNYEDTSNPESKTPRAFRNAILAVAPAPELLASAVHMLRRWKAAQLILKENQRNKLLKEQLEGQDGIIPTLQRQARFGVCRAYSRVVFNGRPAKTLEEKYLVSDVNALAAVNGQQQLKQFLDDQKLIYQALDVLDVDLLCDALISGATPSVEHPGAVTASSVHERALASPRLKLLVNEAPVRDAILRAVRQGKIAVRLPDGTVYDSEGCVKGPPGSRTRTGGPTLSTLKLERDVLLAPMDAPCVAEWIKTDSPSVNLTIAEAAAIKLTTDDAVKAAIGGSQIDAVSEDGEQKVVNNERLRNWTPGPVEQDVVGTWEEAISLAARRPLKRLTLRVTTPDAARTLATLAPPLGAQRVGITVSANGEARDGGQINFMANGLKLGHALNPVDIAAKLVRAMGDDQSFDAQLDLDFGDRGLAGAAPRLEQAQGDAPEGLGITAEFGSEEPK